MSPNSHDMSNPIFLTKMSSAENFIQNAKCYSIVMNAAYAGLFVCVEVLRPSQPNEVMSSAVVYLTTRMGRLSPLSG